MFSNFQEGIGLEIICSGQIIATSHDRNSPNGDLVREILYFREI